MPVKHIPEAIWRKVEKELVKAVIATKKPVKESQIIEILLTKGIKEISEDDYIDAAKKKKKVN